MPLLLQVIFEVQGVLGAVVAFVGFMAVFVPLSLLVWNKFIKPGRERWLERRTLRREAAFTKFQVEWNLDHQDMPVFVLDEKKRMIWVNEAFCKVLNIDSSDAEGKAWHQLIKDSDLSRVLQKWDEAYAHQGPYLNVSTLGRQQKRFVVTADPFIWKGRVLNYVGTIEPIDDHKMLNE